METVTVRAHVSDVEPGAVFDKVAAPERYPELAQTVKSVSVDDEDPDARASSWEVYFRSGVLRWREVAVLDRDALTIDFDQTSGDFEVFRGRWRLDADGSGTDVRFEAEFDFGVPALAAVIDPVAVRVLGDTIATTLQGLFGGDAEVLDVTSSSAAER